MMISTPVSERIWPVRIAKDYILHKALDAHMRDGGRFEHGPAGSSIWGWLYFRVLCGIKG